MSAGGAVRTHATRGQAEMGGLATASPRCVRSGPLVQESSVTSPSLGISTMQIHAARSPMPRRVPTGLDAAVAGVQFGADYNRRPMRQCPWQ